MALVTSSVVFAPDVDRLRVALLVGDQAALVLPLDLRRSAPSAVARSSRLRRRDLDVADGDGDAGAGGEAEADVLDPVDDLGRLVGPEQRGSTRRPRSRSAFRSIVSVAVSAAPRGSTSLKMMPADGRARSELDVAGLGRPRSARGLVGLQLRARHAVRASTRPPRAVDDASSNASIASPSAKQAGPRRSVRGLARRWSGSSSRAPCPAWARRSARRRPARAGCASTA